MHEAAQKLRAHQDSINDAWRQVRLVQALAQPEPMPRELKLAITTDTSSCESGGRAPRRAMRAGGHPGRPPRAWLCLRLACVRCRAGGVGPPWIRLLCHAANLHQQHQPASLSFPVGSCSSRTEPQGACTRPAGRQGG